MTIPDGVSPGQRFLVQLPTTARPEVAEGAVAEGVAAEGAVAAGAVSLLPDPPDPSIQATQAQQEALQAQQAEQQHQRHQQELAQWEAAKRGGQQLIADQKQQTQAQAARQVAPQAMQAVQVQTARADDDDSAPGAARTGEKMRMVLATAAVLVHAATCTSKNDSCPVPHCNKMRRSHAHLVECNRVECMTCLKLKPLLYVHAQHCVATPGEPCVVAWCARAKRELTVRQQAAQRQQLSRRQHAICGSGTPNMMDAAGAAGQSSVIDLTGDDVVPPPRRPPPPKRQRPTLQPDTLAGSQDSATPEPPVTPLSADQAKGERLARYLLVIAHAMKCNDSHGCGMVDCKRTKDLVANHTRSCTQGDACLFPRCALSKKLMLHHRQCRDQACAICVPLRRCMAAAKMSADASSAQPPPQVRQPTKSKEGEVGPASASEASKKYEDEEPFLRRGGRTRIRPEAWYEGPALCSVLAMREAANAVGREFLVRWQGHSAEEDSWEPESNVDERLVRAFVSARQNNAKVPRLVLPGASTSSATLPAAANATAPAPQQGTARKKRRVDQAGSILPPAWLSGAPKEQQRIGDRYQACLPVCAALPAAGGDLATDAAARVYGKSLVQHAARDSAALLTATAFGLDAFSFVAPCDCGLGLFARVTLRAGHVICEHNGPRLPKRLHPRGRYVLKVPGTSTVIDGASENSPFECERSPAVYANHSSQPNARLECRPALTQPGIHRMLIVALEAIEAGQEVRIDYEDSEASGETAYWADRPPIETAWRCVRIHPPPPTLEEPSYGKLEESSPEIRTPLPWEGHTGGDARLQALVPLFSTSTNRQANESAWPLVSTHLLGRSWRECRERWLIIRSTDAHIAGLTHPSTASTSHAEAAAAMAERNRAAAAKAAMEAAGEEMPGEGTARCCILGCTEKLLQCRGLKHVGCAVGRAESWHVLCAPCLGRWFSSQAALRDDSGLSKQTRRTCPVCQAELRTTGSEMRGVADQYAMGLQKVAGTWPEVQQKRGREAATAATVDPDDDNDDSWVEAGAGGTP